MCDYCLASFVLAQKWCAPLVRSPLDHTSDSASQTSILRQIVAGPRLQHPEAGLDLCYVTDNGNPTQMYIGEVQIELTVWSSYRDVGPLRYLSAARIPQPARCSRELSRLETWHQLVYLGIPRRGHRIPRFGGVWAHPSLPLARPPPAAICVDSEYHGQHEELDAATR